MWLTILSDQLPVKRLGEPLPHQLADRTRVHPKAAGLAVPAFVQLAMRPKGNIKYYLRFHGAMFVFREGYSRVPHPFAAIPLRESRD